MNTVKICVLCVKILNYNEKKVNLKSKQIIDVINGLYGIKLEEHDDTTTVICEPCVQNAINISTHINCIQQNQNQVKASILMLKQFIKATEETDEDSENPENIMENNEKATFSAVMKSSRIPPAAINHDTSTTKNALSKTKLKNTTASDQSEHGGKKPKMIETFSLNESIQYYDFNLEKLFEAKIVEAKKGNHYRIAVGKDIFLRHAKYLSKCGDDGNQK